MIYNTNVDFVNDNVYTKFVLNRSIRFQDIEQKLNYGGMTERLTERKRRSKNNGQGESSIAPTFSKRDYKDRIRLYLSKRYQSQTLKKHISATSLFKTARHGKPCSQNLADRFSPWVYKRNVHTLPATRRISTGHLPVTTHTGVTPVRGQEDRAV